MGRIFRQYVRAVVFLSMAACGEDSPTQATTEPRDASEESLEGAEVGAESDAASQWSEPEGDSSPDPSDGDASGSQDRENDAGADAGAAELEDDAGADSNAVVVVDRSGWNCHERDANGPLVVSKVVRAPWSSPVGGQVAKGTYHLVAEEHFVPADATALEAQDCEAFGGAYRETLTVTDREWSRVAQYEGTTGRETFSFALKDKELSLTRLCPTAAEGYRRGYSARDAELRVFDSLRRDNRASGSVVCEYLYLYQRVP